MNSFFKTAACVAAFALAAAGYAQAPGAGAGAPGGVGLAPSAAATTGPVAGGGAAAAPGTPEIDIAEAAGTLTDPTAFIYLSKEYVFNLLVLAHSLGVPGVQFDPDQLPRARASRSTRGRGTSESGVETEWLSGSTEGGRRTLAAARYMAGQGATGESRRAAGGLEAQTSGEDRSDWMRAVSVSNNEEMGKLLEMVEDIPGWEKVARLPLLTSEKQKLDKAIAGIYAMAFSRIAPQQPGGPGYGYQQGAWSQMNTYAEYPEYSQGAIQPSEYGAGRYPGGAPGRPPQQQGPPPVDPQAMGMWYYFYQQWIAWERYVAEEVLDFQKGENDNVYDLDTALDPQDLYLVPQPPNAPPPVIHFDAKETKATQFLSLVRPKGIEPASEQMKRVMEEWASKRAEEDSNRSREIVARLNARKERRFRYREWLNDQTTEIRRLAEDYRRRLSGGEVEIDGVRFLISKEPLMHVPLNARNIVTERLTPYDLFNKDGTLKKPAEKVYEEGAP